LAFNKTGSHLAIWGQTGITVMELPQRRGKYNDYEGGKACVQCKYVLFRYLIIREIPEKLFVQTLSHNVVSSTPKEEFFIVSVILVVRLKFVVR
jgi:hypothetical protein